VYLLLEFFLFRFLCGSLRPLRFEFPSAKLTEKFACLPAGAKERKVLHNAFINNVDEK
jgi:hypothetical protein